ncbi:hypothetical protein HYH03_010231 [Edaphochlamys debaryana]|uniref:Guanylate cyclase domain-containing protein n=1 Tax=Edaphochlamys debaryana TaxID=47281 RepID=A0A835XX24_9CHLO|nr:hypothetical protein HYH03_010231 [Edaphochlamys debaryana]|eukprot:KAG2491445.1 hypothetical protein HYH03_010231 [Edaphochlamys debaryana]
MIGEARLAAAGVYAGGDQASVFRVPGASGLRLDDLLRMSASASDPVAVLVADKTSRRGARNAARVTPNLLLDINLEALFAAGIAPPPPLPTRGRGNPSSSQVWTLDGPDAGAEAGGSSPVSASMALHLLQSRYSKFEAIRLVVDHVNAPLTELLGCGGGADFEGLFSELLSAEPMLKAVLHELCLCVLEGVHAPPVQLMVNHPIRGTTARVVLPLQLQPVVLWRRAPFTAPGTSGNPSTPRAPSAADIPTVAVVMTYQLSAGLRASLQSLHRVYAMLSALSGIVTLFTLRGRVLHQNTASIRYMGLRQGPPSVVGGACTASASLVGGSLAGPAGHLPSALLDSMHPEHVVDASGLSHGSVLRQVFALAGEQLDDMLEDVAEGKTWKGIVRVPPLLTPTLDPGGVGSLLAGRGTLASEGTHAHSTMQSMAVCGMSQAQASQYTWERYGTGMMSTQAGVQPSVAAATTGETQEAFSNLNNLLIATATATTAEGNGSVGHRSEANALGPSGPAPAMRPQNGGTGTGGLSPTGRNTDQSLQIALGSTGGSMAVGALHRQESNKTLLSAMLKQRSVLRLTSGQQETSLDLVQGSAGSTPGTQSGRNDLPSTLAAAAAGGQLAASMQQRSDSQQGPSPQRSDSQQMGQTLLSMAPVIPRAGSSVSSITSAVAHSGPSFISTPNIAGSVANVLLSPVAPLHSAAPPVARQGSLLGTLMEDGVSLAQGIVSAATLLSGTGHCATRSHSDHPRRALSGTNHPSHFATISAGTTFGAGPEQAGGLTAEAKQSIGRRRHALQLQACKDDDPLSTSTWGILDGGASRNRAESKSFSIRRNQSVTQSTTSNIHAASSGRQPLLRGGPSGNLSRAVAAVGGDASDGGGGASASGAGGGTGSPHSFGGAGSKRRPPSRLMSFLANKNIAGSNPPSGSAPNRPASSQLRSTSQIDAALHGPPAAASGGSSSAMDRPKHVIASSTDVELGRVPQLGPAPALSAAALASFMAADSSGAPDAPPASTRAPSVPANGGSGGSFTASGTTRRPPTRRLMRPMIEDVAEENGGDISASMPALQAAVIAASRTNTGSQIVFPGSAGHSNAGASQPGRSNSQGQGPSVLGPGAASGVLAAQLSLALGSATGRRGGDSTGGGGHSGREADSANGVMGRGDEDDDDCWHEITATGLRDPVTGDAAVMLMQVDVSARVRAERRIAEVLEAEHKLLESVFPRHVLEMAAARTMGAGGRGGAKPGSKFSLVDLPLPQNCASVATYHPQVTILFSDIVGFTSMCHEIPATKVMEFLNALYSRLDTLLDVYGCYKVETIGDCYMVAGGLMTRDADGFMTVRDSDSKDELHAAKVFAFAKAMMRETAEVLLPTTGEPVQMRIGLHSGPVMSGIVGSKMPRFCLFGDTVNTASRMESTCPPGCIHVSKTTRECLQDEDDGWEPTGGVQVKGLGMLETFRWLPPEQPSDAHRPAGARGRVRRASSVLYMGGSNSQALSASKLTSLAAGALGSDGSVGRAPAVPSFGASGNTEASTTAAFAASLQSPAPGPGTSVAPPAGGAEPSPGAALGGYAAALAAARRGSRAASATAMGWVAATDGSGAFQSGPQPGPAAGVPGSGAASAAGSGSLQQAASGLPSGGAGGGTKPTRRKPPRCSSTTALYHRGPTMSASKAQAALMGPGMGNRKASLLGRQAQEKA